MFNINHPLVNIASALVNSFLQTPQPPIVFQHRYRPEYNGWDSAQEMPSYSPTNNIKLIKYQVKRLSPGHVYRRISGSPKQRNKHRSLEAKNERHPNPEKIKNMLENMNRERQLRKEKSQKHAVNVEDDKMKYYDLPVRYDTKRREQSADQKNKRYYNEAKPYPTNIKPLQFKVRQNRPPIPGVPKRSPPHKAPVPSMDINYQKRSNSRRKMTASEMDILLSS